jgi:adenylate cyclase class 2
MNMAEIEVKFYLHDLLALQHRLLETGGELAQPRVHEINLRYDTPDKVLLRTGRVLRLRQDREVHLTYKGPGIEEGGARLRQELETSMGDFDIAQAILDALGYHVILMYEKYRTTYRWGEVLVTLDEMPFGNFSEIEGPDSQSIQSAADRLGLSWQARILDSYSVLFEQLRTVLGYTFRDLSFANFKTISMSAKEPGIWVAADR